MKLDVAFGQKLAGRERDSTRRVCVCVRVCVQYDCVVTGGIKSVLCTRCERMANGLKQI